MAHSGGPSISRAAASASADTRWRARRAGPGSRRPTRARSGCAMLSKGRNAEHQHCCERQRPLQQILLHTLSSLKYLWNPKFQSCCAEVLTKPNHGHVSEDDPSNGAYFGTLLSSRTEIPSILNPELRK